MRFGKLPAAEAGAFHLFEQTSNRAVAVDRHGPCRNGQVLARFWFSLCHHKLVLPLMKCPTNFSLSCFAWGFSRSVNDKLKFVGHPYSIVMTPSPPRAVTVKCDIR